MQLQKNSEMYEKGQTLAEAGQYPEALQCFKQYLALEPKDAQAWNDTAVVLYCQGKNDESIEHFEKALHLSPDSGQIIWNLCEAYINCGYPELAIKFFDKMEMMDILSADVVNRTANAFLKQESFGNAIETLLLSLELVPNQEILPPMIEVIRSKRPRLAFFSDRPGEAIENVFGCFKRRLVTEKYVSATFEQVDLATDCCDIAWFDGCGETLSNISNMNKDCRVIVRLDEDDIYTSRPDTVNWDNVDFLILPVSSYARQALVEMVPGIESMTRVQLIRHGVDSNIHSFTEKTAGKRIVHLGNISAQNNIMLLLQCMQKLNYIDRDYRLYLAGEFQNRKIANYVANAVDALGLTDVVFFQPLPTNINKYLSDKHYIVSTAIGQDSLNNVLKGMSCGLKPLVHNFPGAGEFLPSDYLFDIAEDFCEMVLSASYEPMKYRQLIESQYTLRSELKLINDIMVKVEKEAFAERRRQIQLARDNQLQPVSTESMPQAEIIAPIEAMPIIPISNKDMVVVIPDSVQETPSAAEKAGKSIDKIAEEALRASKSLTELANSNSMDSTEVDWAQTGIDKVDTGQIGTSLESAVKEKKLADVANQFSRDAERSSHAVKRVKVHQNPFVS